MPLKPGHVHYEKRPLRLAPLTGDGLPDLAALNAEFAPTWLEDEKQPRWVAKPTVAYLWARTVPCKGCRATLPLLKTRWLAKKDNKRVLLTLEPTEFPPSQGGVSRTPIQPFPPSQGGVSRRDGGVGLADGSNHPGAHAPPLLEKEGNNKAGFFKGVVFGIETGVPARGKTAAEKKEHDKTLGAGTMSRSGAKCPCCGVLMTMEDIRFAGRQGQLGAVMTAVVVDGLQGKEYRLPTAHEIEMAEAAGAEIERVFREVPFGVPEEPVPQGASRKGGGSAFTAYLVSDRKPYLSIKSFTYQKVMCLF